MPPKRKPDASSVRIDRLRPDASNARRHSDRNLELIETSLREVGAARSIVIDEKNRVLAGNGTVEAAQRAGISRVRIIDAKGDEIIAVRRRNLTDAQKTRLSILDNRAGELAEWSPEALAALREAGANLDGAFTEGELAALLGGPPGRGTDIGERYSEQYGVIVICASEKEQEKIYDRFTAEGLTCRVVTT